MRPAAQIQALGRAPKRPAIMQILVTRPFWYQGQAYALGAVLDVPESLAAELQANGKAAAAAPDLAPAASPDLSPAVPAPKPPKPKAKRSEAP